jgi:hypothetical protein
VILQVKLPVLIPLALCGPAIVGVGVVLQQTPLSATPPPPLAVTFPPPTAVVDVIEPTCEEVTVGNTIVLTYPLSPGAYLSQEEMIIEKNKAIVREMATDLYFI